MNDGRVLLAGGGEENDLGTNHHAVLGTVAADETFELSTISLTKRDDEGALPSHRCSPMFRVHRPVRGGHSPPGLKLHPCNYDRDH